MPSPADRDHAVVTTLLECHDAGREVGLDRIAFDIGEDADRNSCLAHAPSNARDHVGLGESCIRDKQWPGDAKSPAEVRQLGDAPRSRNDARRKIPGSSDLNVHGRLSMMVSASKLRRDMLAPLLVF